MQGSVRKRCQCPVRYDTRGRLLACTKPHGSWCFVTNIPAAAGEARKQVMRSGFATKKDAQDALAALLAEVAAGRYVAPSQRTLEVYLEQWLVGVQLELAATAYTNYRILLRRYVLTRIGDLPLTKITAARLTALYGELLTTGNRTGGPLSPATVRTVHRILSKAFTDAVRERQLMENPATYAKLPRRQRPEMKTWTAEQATTFLSFAATDRMYAAWLLALACGLRRGELAGLRWIDLDLDAATVAIVNQRTVDGEWNIVTKEPKGTSRRTIDLGPGAVSALRRHRAQTAAERLTAGAVYQDTGLVFTHADGSAFHPDRLTRMFRAGP